MPPKQILLVEDDSLDQIIVKKALQEVNPKYNLIIKENGAEALSYLKENKEKVFFVLSDVKMPKMNGFELLEEVGKDEALKSNVIPFIFYSTSAAQQDVINSYRLCGQGYFQKPNTIEEMEEILRQIIGYWTFSKTPKNN